MAMQDTLHALADPTRREILNLLKQSRMSAGDIVKNFSVSGAAISRHLSVLKEAGLIRDEREGKFIYYELNTTVLEEIMLWTVAVFVLPLIIFVIHLFCIFAVSTDPKSKNINDKMYSIVLWICPLVSVFICNCIYGYTLGFIKNIGFITGLLLGTLYIVLGNYLPTVKPNYTVGIRVPWTLNDQDNWYHTHRFSGKCMVLGGVLLIMLLPFMDMFILFTLALVPGILPIIYSYLYHRKKAR